MWPKLHLPDGHHSPDTLPHLYPPSSSVLSAGRTVTTLLYRACRLSRFRDLTECCHTVSYTSTLQIVVKAITRRRRYPSPQNANLYRLKYYRRLLHSGSCRAFCTSTSGERTPLPQPFDLPVSCTKKLTLEIRKHHLTKRRMTATSLLQEGGSKLRKWSAAEWDPPPITSTRPKTTPQSAVCLFNNVHSLL